MELNKNRWRTRILGLRPLSITSTDQAAFCRPITESSLNKQGVHMTNKNSSRYETDSDTQSNQPRHKGRRQLMTGGLALGATLPLLPSSWTRPVVQSVLLPAHAQTSADPSLKDPEQEKPNEISLPAVSVSGDCRIADAVGDFNDVTLTCGQFGLSPQDDTIAELFYQGFYQDFAFIARFEQLGPPATGQFFEARAECNEPESIVGVDYQVLSACGVFRITATLSADGVNETASVTDITVVPV